MLFVLGRYDEDASTYYQEASQNNEIFSDKPIQMMSKLTHNLLRAIDYDAAARKRQHNAAYLHSHLKRINKMKVQVPYGAFMYPLMVNSSIGGDSLEKYFSSLRSMFLAFGRIRYLGQVQTKWRIS